MSIDNRSTCVKRNSLQVTDSVSKMFLLGSGNFERVLTMVYCKLLGRIMFLDFIHRLIFPKTKYLRNWISFRNIRRWTKSKKRDSSKCNLFFIRRHLLTCCNNMYTQYTHVSEDTYMPRNRRVFVQRLQVLFFK
jgi:hypothetical protein